MEIQTTTLRITKKLSSVIGYIDNNPVAKDIFSILVGRKYDPLIDINNIENLTATDNLVIQIQSNDGGFADVLLPESIYAGMIQYFQNSPELPKDLDCLGWIVEILGGDRGDRFVDDGDYDYIGVKRIHSSSELMSGDIISISDGTEEGFKKGNYHYALYVGNDIFLSKLGYSGPIVATNMLQLMDICPGYDFIVKLLLQHNGQK